MAAMKEANPARPQGRRVLRELARLYPDVRCALDFADPLQLLVSTILSAQCTDARVNRVTPALFARYPDAAAFATAKPKELEALIRPTGFYRNKARNIIRCCREIVERHGGEVPGTMEDLASLPGVGRKTANVVLGNAFGVPGIPVDTHVGRLSRRLGLTTHADPVKVECDLMAVLPRKEWVVFAHRMMRHGRLVCRSRRPRCPECTLDRFCPRVGVPTARPAKSPPAQETP
jgi:endonuclease-3